MISPATKLDIGAALVFLGGLVGLGGDVATQAAEVSQHVPVSATYSMASVIAVAGGVAMAIVSVWQRMRDSSMKVFKEDHEKLKQAYADLSLKYYEAIEKATRDAAAAAAQHAVDLAKQSFKCPLSACGEETACGHPVKKEPGS
jgi:hypothetical protein